MRLLLVCAALVALLAGCTGRPDPQPTFPQGSTAHEITFEGVDRDYRLFVPAGLGDGPAPLVVMLHGGFGSAEQAELVYGWDARAAREGFIVAYPQGLSRSWNAGTCCGPSMERDVDDVGFIRAVLADAGAHHEIDPDRTYATGMSNGGIMAYRLACEAPGLFAAIAPVSATMLVDCEAPGPVSVLHIQGGLDESIPPDGSPGAGTQQIDGPPLADVLRFWREVDGCGAPITVELGAEVAATSATCDDGTAVAYIEIADAGHQWPGALSSEIRDELGGDPPSKRLDATDTIWQFFAAHTRPAGGGD